MTAAMRAAHESRWRAHLDVDAVLRAQGADPARLRQRGPRLVALAERALHEGGPRLEPASVVRRFTVEESRHGGLRFRGGGQLNGRLIAAQCAPAEEIVVIAVTIGAALERFAAETAAREPSFGLALDGLGSAAVQTLSTLQCERVAAAAARSGASAGPSLAPGMEGWPLESGQREIFHLLGDQPLPVELMASGMMTPRKSLTFVIGVGAAMRSGASHCDFCGSRARCRHRRAG